MADIDKLNIKADAVIKCVNIMVETDDPEMLDVMYYVAKDRLRDIYIMKKAGFKDERKEEMS